MKYLLSLIVTISILCTSLSAVEYGQLLTNETGWPVSLDLNEGDVWEVLSAKSGYGQDGPFLKITTQGYDIEHSARSFGAFAYYNSNLTSYAVNDSRTVIGPATISLQAANINNLGHSIVFYKLTRASEVEYKNVNIISLPASTVGAGTHEIVVEASDDLQTWTPVHSSSIGGNKAFFRTRVVEIGD
jgi:hypothetical protein